MRDWGGKGKSRPAGPRAGEKKKEYDENQNQKEFPVTGTGGTGRGGRGKLTKPITMRFEKGIPMPKLLKRGHYFPGEQGGKKRRVIARGKGGQFHKERRPSSLSKLTVYKKLRKLSKKEGDEKGSGTARGGESLKGEMGT